MSATTRTDIHRPSAPEFDPELYTCVGAYDLSSEWGGDGHADAVDALVARGYRFAGSTAGGCGHCGARIRYAALMIHSNGTDMIFVGEQCFANRFDGVTKAEFQTLRAAAAGRAARGRVTLAIADLVDAHPLLAELTYPQTGEWSGSFLADVAYRFRRDGQLSERQVTAAEGAVLREIEWRARDAARDAQRAAEAATATPVPSGRMVIEGEVLSTKWQETGFGETQKMLVKHDSGWKAWGTVPAAIDVEKGDRVRFTASIKPSDDDLHFGFFSRPVKAEIL